MFFLKKLNSPTVRRLVSSCLIVFLIVATVFVALPEPAFAQSPPFVPFGGMNLFTMWCICSFNLWVIVGPPVGGSFIFQPGMSILYLFGQIWRPGAWLLGLALPAPVPCIQLIAHHCVPIGFGLPMLIVGTSM